MYVYIYIYIYIHTYTYIHTVSERERGIEREQILKHGPTGGRSARPAVRPPPGITGGSRCGPPRRRFVWFSWVRHRAIGLSSTVISDVDWNDSQMIRWFWFSDDSQMILRWFSDDPLKFWSGLDHNCYQTTMDHHKLPDMFPMTFLILPMKIAMAWCCIPK